MTKGRERTPEELEQEELYSSRWLTIAKLRGSAESVLKDEEDVDEEVEEVTEEVSEEEGYGIKEEPFNITVKQFNNNYGIIIEGTKQSLTLGKGYSLYKNRLTFEETLYNKYKQDVDKNKLEFDSETALVIKSKDTLMTVGRVSGLEEESLKNELAKVVNLTDI